MKKLFVLLLCLLTLSSCNEPEVITCYDEAPRETSRREKTLTVTENSVRKLSDLTMNELTGEAADEVLEIMDGDIWKDEIIDCESNYEINLRGRIVYYNSEKGVLNQYNLASLSYYSSKTVEIEGKSRVLTENERARLNEIIEKY